MRTFAFLKNTPDWAKQNNCGQYNGYLAIDIKYVNEIIKNAIDEESPQEVTTQAIATMKEINPLYPITIIDEESDEFPCSYMEEIGPLCPITPIDEESGEFLDSYVNLPQPQEITMNAIATMEEIGPLYPITPIDEEACNSKFLIVGFDTCHSWNSWEKDNYESVKKDTLDWLEEVNKYLETIKEMG